MRDLRPTSLTSRLVVTAVALVALVSVLIATATTVAIGSYLTDELDDALQRSHDRDIGVLERGVPLAVTPSVDRPDSGRSEGRDFGEARGQGERTVTAYLAGDVREGWVLTEQGDREALSASVLDELAEVVPDGEIDATDITGLGSYRVTASRSGAVTVVTGLPTDRVDGTLSSLMGWEALFTGLGVVAAAAGAFVVVRRQLRPLREVARTAHEVVALPLASGEVGITARVPEGLTDERTEVGQVGAALNTLLGHVEDALDARHLSEQRLRRFVADASHELRTPLATVLGYAELTRRSGDTDPARMADAMRRVESEASRMASLVEDLLLLARLDAGRPLAREEVDLTRLALESTADAQVRTPDHSWRLDLADEPVTVVGDEQRLHQVITNLLTNAGRHTPPGTTVTVGVRPSAAGDAALLSVHDDGPGLPAPLRDTVFDRFSRGDTARTRDSGGSGLGLSIARAISTAHGGDLTVASAPGDTTFTLTVPRGAST